jgi:hypothetical protein
MHYKFFHGSGATPKEDVVVFEEVPDGMCGLTEKLKAKCRWAVSQGYDYTFSVFPDTYMCPERLLSIVGDYVGNRYQFPNCAPFAQGGPGYLLSRRSCEILANEPSSYLNDDTWAGDVLHKAGVHLINDQCFTAFGPGPQKNNYSKTVHLSTQPGGYTGENLRQEHKRWLESL